MFFSKPFLLLETFRVKTGCLKRNNLKICIALVGPIINYAQDIDQPGDDIKTETIGEALGKRDASESDTPLMMMITGMMMTRMIILTINNHENEDDNDN